MRGDSTGLAQPAVLSLASDEPSHHLNTLLWPRHSSFLRIWTNTIEADGPQNKARSRYVPIERLKHCSEGHDEPMTVSPEKWTGGNRLKSQQEVYIIVKNKSTHRKRSLILLALGGHACFRTCSPNDTESLTSPSCVGSNHSAFKFREIKTSSNPVYEPASQMKTYMTTDT